MLEKPTLIGSIGYTFLLCFGIWFFAGMIVNMRINVGGPPAAMAYVNETLLRPLVKASPFGLILIHLCRYLRWKSKINIEKVQDELYQTSNEANKRYEKRDEEFEEEQFILGPDEEKAYRIFGISPTATDEQIRKLYKKLAQIYHPDASVVSDDERFKEINWAYGILKAARNMS
ncbi:MAG: J domain-containing protein [Pyrinomonadaceae bacterium]